MGRPLHLAAEAGHANVCQFLVENGADVNVCNKEDVTPLLLAVEERHLKVCKLLAMKGANRLASSIHGRTPLAVARDAGDLDLEAALWPQSRKRTHMVLGPEALLLMRRHMQLR